LDGIAEREREVIFKSAERRHIAAKQIIVQHCTRASHLFLLCSGRVKYYRVTGQGDEVLLALLIPGDVFGLATFLAQPCNYIGTAEAMRSCEVLVWEHSKIREISGLFPQLAANAYSITLRYLAGYASRHVNLVTKTAEQRLARTLLNLAYRTGDVHPLGVELQVTNQQLGALADVGTFTASRLLNAWKRKGMVTKNRGRVLIQTPEMLPVG
jgi:CRP-like cAMP-binding protein